MRLPPRPELTWKDDGTPVDDRVGDIYFSREDGLEETRAVFLQGCGLPQRWHGRAQFTVAELGFGTGLNFLALWQLWRQAGNKEGWLHFVSFEGYPLDREDAAKALSAWPELAPLAQKLIEKWPARAKGVRQIDWPEERLSLVLHLGEVAETLPQSDLTADAWFLDGFSPAKNQAMWDERLWPLVRERSAPGARVATFTVAGAVRRGLEAAGFEVARMPGHGRKRQRLEATLLQDRSADRRSSIQLKLAVIGCGIGGLISGSKAVQKGASVTLFEVSDGPAMGASGNPLALVMPRLDAGDTPEARLLIDAYLSAREFYRGQPGAEEVDVHHRPKDEAEARRFAKLLADPPLGLELLEATRGGVLHKGAVIVRPGELLPALARDLDVRCNTEAEVDLAARTVNGEAFDAIILATGWHMAEALPFLRLKGRAGQVDYYDSSIEAPPSALASGHYALASGRARLWGASYQDHAGGLPEADETARQANAEGLAALSPYWQGEARKADVQSRAGVRATTPDRLPLIGALPDYQRALEVFASLRKGQAVEAEMPVSEGVYVAGGFGSRGFTWAPWAADALMAELTGAPMPLAREAQRLVAPGRQILRDIKRGLI